MTEDIRERIWNENKDKLSSMAYKVVLYEGLFGPIPVNVDRDALRDILPTMLEVEGALAEM